MKLFFLALYFVSSIFAVPLKESESIENISPLHFLDQHNNLITIQNDIKFIFFVSDMEASKVAHSFFVEKKETWMKQKKVVFISDIHKMPNLITKYVALPKMKSYPYPILLIQDEVRGKFFPQKKSFVTLLILKNFIVQEIIFLSSLEDFKQVLKKIES